MENPPAWADEKGLALWVNKVRDDQAECDLVMLRNTPNLEVIVTKVEARASREGMRYLNHYLFCRHPVNLYPGLLGPPVNEAPVAERFSESRTSRGRPKMEAWKRRLINPIHDAADDFREIQRILRLNYPNQSRGQIYDQALYITSDRCGVRPETLDNHLRRSRRDRRRL
jgi:hypothetical protein